MDVRGLDGRIAGLEGTRPIPPTVDRAASAGTAAEPGIRQDDVRISGPAREAAKIMNEVRKAPDVREEKVLAMKKALASGQYQVSGEDVAEKLIRESMLGSIL